MHIPTDDEILTCDNVPIDIAARYIGKTPEFVRCGIIPNDITGKPVLPFGFGVKMSGGKYSYCISPGLLVAYKRGRAPELSA